jgi:hypothetical protein
MKNNRDGNYVATSAFCNKAQEVITNDAFIRKGDIYIYLSKIFWSGKAVVPVTISNDLRH